AFTGGHPLVGVAARPGDRFLLAAARGVRICDALSGLGRSLPAWVQGLAPPGYSQSPFQGWVSISIGIQGLALPGLTATYFAGEYPEGVRCGYPTLALPRLAWLRSSHTGSNCQRP